MRKPNAGGDGAVAIVGPERLDRAADVVRGGGVVAYATGSFYALGADPFQPTAVEALLRLKGRDRDKPVALIAGGIADVERRFGALPGPASLLAEAFWPGALTLLFEANEELPMAVRGEEGKVGVRVPALPSARALATACGGLLTATSANRAGEPPLTTAQEVRFGLDWAELGGAGVILDGGTTPGGSPSTVLNPAVFPARIVRPGRISAEQLSAVLGYAVSLPR